MASSEWRPEMLLNILQSTGQTSQQGVIPPKPQWSRVGRVLRSQHSASLEEKHSTEEQPWQACPVLPPTEQGRFWLGDTEATIMFSPQGSTNMHFQPLATGREPFGTLPQYSIHSQGEVHPKCQPFLDHLYDLYHSHKTPILFSTKFLIGLFFFLNLF